MKKVAIIGIVGLPAKYGGFESFTEQLVQRIWDQFDVTVYCQKSAFQEHPAKIGKVNLKYLPLKANGILSVPYDMLGILDAVRYADTLLILGVGGCTLLPLLRLFGCKKNIVRTACISTHDRGRICRISKRFYCGRGIHQRIHKRILQRIYKRQSDLRNFGFQKR